MSDHFFSNILDRRGTGCYKTTEAIKQLNHEVEIGNVVVYVMSSYQNLKEIEREITSSNTLTYRGRRQPGMCVLYEEIKPLHDFIHPKFACLSCWEHIGCQFIEQLSSVERMARLDEGFAILTVPRNLKYVLKLVGRRHPHVIFDDVSLAQVVLQEEIVKKKTIRSAFPYLEICPTLTSVSEMLLDGDQDPKSIVKHVKSVKIEYTEELDQVRTRIEEDYDLGIDLPDLTYLYHLEYADRVVINDPVDESNVRIYIDLTKQLRKCQVRYLNATPSQGDLEAMKWLGPYDVLADPSKHRDNWIVLQLSGVKYTKQSLCDSNPLELKIRQISSSVEKQLIFINQPLLFMSKRHANKNRFYGFFSDNYPDLMVEFVDYFSPQSYGTNKYRNCPVSVVVGAAIKDPTAFCHPCYDDIRKPEEEIEKEKAIIKKSADIGKKCPPLFVYPVPREISDSDFKNSIVQMIGRNLREGDDADQVKIAIVITDIDLADETGYIPENGARVEQFRSIEKLKGRLLDLVKKGLDQQVLDEIIRQIGVRLTLGEAVGLSQASKAYHEQTGVSERRIKKFLEFRYNLCEVMNKQTKSTKILQFKQYLGNTAASQPVTD